MVKGVIEMNYLISDKLRISYGDVTIDSELYGDMLGNSFRYAVEFQLHTLNRELMFAFVLAQSTFNEVNNGSTEMYEETKFKMMNCSDFISNGQYFVKLNTLRNGILSKRLDRYVTREVCNVISSYIRITNRKYSKEMKDKLDQVCRVATWVREAFADLELTLKSNGLIEKIDIPERCGLADKFDSTVIESLLVGRRTNNSNYKVDGIINTSKVSISSNQQYLSICG